MTYLQYHFTPVTEEQNDMLVAILSPIGFTGFEETHESLYAFIPENAASELIEEKLQHTNLIYSISRIDERNWNEEWERGFEPVDVEGALGVPFVHIRAAFHPPCKRSRFELVITPKMSFGTGHHATTHLLVQWMEDITFSGKKVIDFGTGTGILGILAAKMGASSVLGIDNDEWSINNAHENVKSNNTPVMELLHAHRFEGNAADIILANINLNIILENLPAMINACKPGGIILLSGLMTEDEQKIREVWNEKDGELTVRHRANWIALRINKY